MPLCILSLEFILQNRPRLKLGAQMISKLEQHGMGAHAVVTLLALVTPSLVAYSIYSLILHHFSS